MTVAMVPATLFAEPPPVAVTAVDRAEANRLLTRWGHELGGCDRPFGQDHHVLSIHRIAVAVTVTASTVSPTVTDEAGRVWQREDIVELARICRSPDAPWATRPMLRLWREALAFEWSHWQPRAVVSYSLPGKAGHIYRHDGWTFVRWCKPARPGRSSTWSKPSQADQLGNGRKGLWIYRYPEPAA